MKKDYVWRNLGLDPTQVLLEWARVHKDEYYNIDRSRERMSPALSKTRTYHLRAPDIEASRIVRTESTQDIMTFKDSRLLGLFPCLHKFIVDLGNDLGSGTSGGAKCWKTLGRIFVTRLDPDENIGRHVDRGNYFDQLHRFHIPLESSGSYFCWDAMKAPIEVGKVYLVNNSIPHWVENGPGFRTHVIFDAA